VTEATSPSRDAQRHPRIGLPVGIGLGASAGGPRALLMLLAGLELPRSALAFLVQHIHPRFTGVLSRRLNEAAALSVVAAEDGATALPGRLYMAPGGRHLVVERARPGFYRMRLTDQPPRHGVRPSVDQLFLSLAAAFGPRAIGVVLTGMGRDGVEGAKVIKAQGGTILAEAESTCIVYGMPRALAEAGLADRMVPIGEMAEAIREAAMEVAGLHAPAVPPGQG
jgi:two-component system, chemotaxis family, protein-glutamate methylesterase/glutaminase